MNLQGHFGYGRMLRYCLAPVLTMIFTSVYGVVDGFFISNFAGKTAFAAVNLVMPALMILACLGLMFGSGGTALVARTLGEDKPEQANRYFSMTLTAATACSLVLGIAGIIWMPDIAKMLGAEPGMLLDCVEYGRSLLFFNLMATLQYFFQPFFSAAGKPSLGFAFTVGAGLTNIVLDWLFIAVFGWGVPGAAIATGLGQSVGAIGPLLYFAWQKNRSLLRLVPALPEWKPLLRAAMNGLSELLSNVAGSIVGILFNFQLLHYIGADGVAAFGVLMYVSMIFSAIFFGFSMGISPVISYNFGAGNHAELHSLLKKSLLLNGVFGIIMAISAFGMAGILAHIFVGYDAALYAITITAFHICCWSYLGSGLNVFLSAFFTALNNGTVSAAISVARSLLLPVLFVFLLPVLIGVSGIWLSVVVTEIFGLLVALFFLFKENRRYQYLKA